MMECPKCKAVTISGLPQPTPDSAWLCHGCGYKFGVKQLKEVKNDE